MPSAWAASPIAARPPACCSAPAEPKIRISQTQKALPPGRYKITAYIRGLDIGEGIWRQNTELAFDGKYMRLNKNGTFGWTPLTYVAEVKANNADGPSFGLMAPGYFWIDDVSLERVGNDVPLTGQPVLGKEESPIAPPAPLGRGGPLPGLRLPQPAGLEHCYACGSPLGSAKVAGNGPAVKRLVSLRPLALRRREGGPTDGHRRHQGPAAGQGLRLLEQPQDWSATTISRPTSSPRRPAR